MAYEDIFKYIGDFGRYQKRIYFLLCLTAISCGFHKLAGVFLMARPEYRCRLPTEFSNASYQLSNETWQSNYPVDSFGKYQTCQRFEANATNPVYCNDFIFDDSRYKSSTVIEWTMICGRAWLRATSDALFMIGVLVGSIVFGQLSDNIGRKPVFFALLVLQVIFGVLAGIAPDYITYTIARLMIGATTSGVFLVSYVLAMEMVGPSYRLFTGVAVQMFFSLGYIVTAVFAYFYQDWREFQIAITLPGLVFMCYYWFIPESARWLISKNRKDEAIKLIEAVAKENKVTIPQAVLNGISDDQKEVKDPEEKKPTLIDLFRFPNLRKKTLLVIFGTLAFVSGLLSLYLPETLNKKLPETIEEGERFGKKDHKDFDTEMGNAEEMKKLNGTTANETAEQNGHKKVEN